MQVDARKLWQYVSQPHWTQNEGRVGIEKHEEDSLGGLRKGDGKVVKIGNNLGNLNGR